MTDQPAARPRRSVLYMPGSNARALEKGKSLPADALILDLEDAVTPDAKANARDQVVQAVRAGGYAPREVAVRVNPLNGAWGPADVVAAATCGADALLLPKVESAAMVQDLEKRMEAAGAPSDMAIWTMIETPKGVLNAQEIAAASDRLAVFVMGTSDLVKDLHAEHTNDRQPVLSALSWCVLAARAYGRAIVDGVHLDLNDDEGLEAHCRQGRALGMDGKTLIHPKTVETANRVFAPSEEQIAYARRIIEAHAEAQRRGEGVAVLDGQLIENLHVENAQRLVALAEAIAQRTAA
ncbi:HpcH/HpaI aldolase/citrate lyase family protein [Rhodovibrio salinarum]|uniref:CoA ester lyase n=1 Tax=Rhodovibrio salinarum TaxID=1087 RepID=A0A934QI52_9PROT|nr:CoA ester lyase [Rhodovibrio salinarum]MBK1697142.1 CoA ester lyase [Rhodovibrio salinarum]